MLQDIMKKHAPVNESNERKVDESAFDWTRTLAYLTQILSRAKEARQAQLIPVSYTHLTLPTKA